MSHYLNSAARRPPIRYFGGKWSLAQWIISLFPPHDHYVEPFCGGASVLFRKHPSAIETINDSDGEVVNFFRVLRERPDDLIGAIELTPYAREELVLASEPASDPLERARRFYVRARMSFGSYQRYSTGWSYVTLSHGKSSRKVREWNDHRALAFAVNRLKAVQIEHDDALSVIPRFDTPKTLFYVDPPYVRSGRGDSRLRYVNEMTDEAHVQLAAVLHSVRGMVVLSGYACPLYDELYANWTRVDCSASTNGNIVATESVWLSPNVSGMSTLPLFGGQP